jgi:hypothetical protein
VVKSGIFQEVRKLPVLVAGKNQAEGLQAKNEQSTAIFTTTCHYLSFRACPRILTINVRKLQCPLFIHGVNDKQTAEKIANSLSIW